MLTTSVNIAVFAAFSFCIRDDLLSNAEFKPFCRLRERDIARYGWQKRQDCGKKVATDGTVGNKNGNVLTASGCFSTLPTHKVHADVMALFGSLCGCSGASAAGWPSEYGTNLP